MTGEQMKESEEVEEEGPGSGEVEVKGEDWQKKGRKEVRRKERREKNRKEKEVKEGGRAGGSEGEM